MKKIVGLSFLLSSLFLTSNVRANLPNWPDWTQQSNIIKLDYSYKKSGEKINAMVFSWPTSTGKSSGVVEFGYILADGSWQGTGKTGTFNANSKNDLSVEFMDDVGKKVIHIDNAGVITANNIIEGHSVPVHKEVSVRLSKLPNQPVFSSTNFTETRKPYIYLETPLELGNGKTATIINLQDDGSVKYGIQDADGHWKSIGVTDEWNYSRDRETILIGDLGGNKYKRINAKSGSMSTPEGKTIKVTAMSDIITKQIYVPNISPKMCRAKYGILK
jgi:hypothetical protein